MSTKTIVAAVIDQDMITIYHSDGSDLEIPQGDPRVQVIIDQVLPIVQVGGTITLDLSEVSDFTHFEEKTSGLIRFFKVATNKLTKLFGSDEDETIAPTGSFGKLPQAEAIQEILDHAKPVNNLSSDETVIAVVDDKIIPGVEQLKNQFRNSRITGSTKGLENLLKRLAAIIDQRQHSVEDVLRFLEKGDLPVADDGSIIAYKMLNRSGNRFFDCHTGKIPQRVGSYVVVNENLVDRNRRNECSNGLHIARRAYLQHFSGHVCVICKIAPEDVVTVPHGDPNKVRVCGYHIIFELDDESMAKLRQNQPISDNPKAQKIIGRAISGDHIGKIEEVRVNGKRGENVEIISLIEPKADKPAAEPGKKKASKPKPIVKPARAIDDLELSKEKASADMKTINTQQKSMASMTRTEKIEFLLGKLTSPGSNMNQIREAAMMLTAIKKTAKQPWNRLKVSDKQVKLIEDLLNDKLAPIKASKKTKAISAALKGDAPKATPKFAAKPKKKPAVKKPVDPAKIALSDIQYQALTLARAKHLNKNEIARRTGVSTRTIGRLLEKFG